MNRTHTRTLATLALLCAMEIILARFCVIWITNSIKITFEAIPILRRRPAFRPGLAPRAHRHPHPAGSAGRTAAPHRMEKSLPAPTSSRHCPRFCAGQYVLDYLVAQFPLRHPVACPAGRSCSAVLCHRCVGYARALSPLPQRHLPPPGTVARANLRKKECYH